jgi:extracellular factor (EF) 3-hydroxypalmitic acid methyl ester biosynthesis protein
MKVAFNGNGNGNGHANGIFPPAVPSSKQHSQVTFHTPEGEEVRGRIASVTHHAVVFELGIASFTPELSSTLGQFKIVFQDQVLYSGRAVVSSVTTNGAKIFCEATLDPGSWSNLDFALQPDAGSAYEEEIKNFISDWQKLYRVGSEFKIVVADLQIFFHDVQLWLEKSEAGIQAAPPDEQAGLERAALQQLAPVIRPMLDRLFSRFESVCHGIDAAQAPAHRAFCHRQLHPFLMCAPFMHRIYHKPLGYAGDYEMIDMIMRNGYEGRNLFAKLLHSYIIDQAPARSVRNRGDYFMRKFVEETCRVTRSGRTARFFSLGCGPAREVQNFLAEHLLSDRTQFQLLDFNEETLAHTAKIMEQSRHRHGRQTRVKMVKKSVSQLLRMSGRALPGEEPHDFIYCSGLYDYLNDHVCKELNTNLYDKLSPGGMLVVTNFDPSNPIQNIMEYMFEWFLIYRNGQELAQLAPAQASPDDCVVVADATGCNVFLEVRKPL